MRITNNKRARSSPCRHYTAHILGAHASTLAPLMTNSCCVSALMAVVRVAVNTDIMMIPPNIQTRPNKRAGMDLGARSPYLP